MDEETFGTDVKDRSAVDFRGMAVSPAVLAVASTKA
jgi:hypothetical protein